MTEAIDTIDAEPRRSPLPDLTRRGVVAGLCSTVALGASPACAAQAEGAVTPEQFGARGDGVADDTDSFAELSAHLQARDGGIVEFRRAAVYRIGRQTRGTSTYLEGHAALAVKDVSRLIVRMNGATMKFRDGLKFGSFDPRTGAPKTTALPHVEWQDRADIGYAIMAENVGFFSVSGGTIDGNSREAVIGGFWGDTGRQCLHHGIASYRCDRVEWSDLRIVDSCLDGLLYAFNGLRGSDRPRPLRVSNVTVERVGRNCVSVTGTNDAQFTGCTFRAGGDAPNRRVGKINSAPASCFDLEAEGAECRNLVIRRSNLISGRPGHTCFVADSGASSDILIEDSLLVGTVWTSKPRTLFSRCRVQGNFGKLLGGQRHSADNSRIVDCHIVDDPPFEPRKRAFHAIDLEGAGPGVVIERSEIVVARSRLNLKGGTLRDVTIRFATGASTIESGDFAILMDRATLERVTIREEIPARERPAEPFYVTPPGRVTEAAIISPAEKLFWNSWSRSAGGYAGPLRN